MRWDAVLQAISAEAAADTTLTGVFTAAGIRKSGTHEWAVPSLEYTLISDTISELWATHVVQFDLFTLTMEDLATGERQLRRLFQHEEPVLIQGIYMWAMYLDGTGLEGPAREGHYGRALRFSFKPFRALLVEGITDNVLPSTGEFSNAFSDAFA